MILMTTTAHIVDSPFWFIFWVCVFFFVLIVGLMTYFVFKYRRRDETEPPGEGATHNTPLEVTWTVVPIIILVTIGAFSLPVLFDQQEIPEGDITIKATGFQWYWGYEYVDAGVDGVEPGAIAFESFMLDKASLAFLGLSKTRHKAVLDEHRRLQREAS